jgi:hypothetical protein
MVHRDWERQVHEALVEEERREASILCNPRLARVYIERGVGVALFVVLTYSALGIKGLAPESRKLLLIGAIFGVMVAVSFVSMGLIGLANQLRPRSAPGPRPDEPPPIGW